MECNPNDKPLSSEALNPKAKPAIEPELDFKIKAEIRDGLSRTKKLLDSRILWDSKSEVYQQSVLIEVLINLKDLLIKADKLGNRISFTDDVLVDDRLKITDVTDLISNFRDAACHNDSYRRKSGNGVFAFNTMFGKGIFIKFGDIAIGNPYQDDVAFNMGLNTVLLKRHIERAYEEVSAFLTPISVMF